MITSEPMCQTSWLEPLTVRERLQHTPQLQGLLAPSCSTGRPIPVVYEPYDAVWDCYGDPLPHTRATLDPRPVGA